VQLPCSRYVTEEKLWPLELDVLMGTAGMSVTRLPAVRRALKENALHMAAPGEPTRGQQKIEAEWDLKAARLARHITRGKVTAAETKEFELDLGKLAKYNKRAGESLDKKATNLINFLLEVGLTSAYTEVHAVQTGGVFMACFCFVAPVYAIMSLRASMEV
jgi:hypothetical protein